MKNILFLTAFLIMLITTSCRSQNLQVVVTTDSPLITASFKNQGTYSSTITYNANDVVTYTGNQYYSLVGNNINNTPVTGSSFWGALGNSSGVGGGISELIAATPGSLSVNILNPTTAPIIGVVANAGYYIPTTSDQTTWNGKQDSGLALLKSNNLSDLTNNTIARTNLGLGTAATAASSSFDPAGAAANALTNAQTFSANANNITSGLVKVANLTPCGASGTNHSAGILPDPGPTLGSTRYLREDCTWDTPSGSGSGMVYPSGTGLASVINGNTWSTTYGLSGTGTTIPTINNPTFINPTLGVALATSVNGTSIPTNSTLLISGNNLSDLSNITTARTNLGLGTASQSPASAFDAAGAASSALTAAQSSSLQKSNNLSDLSNITTARTNLGLGTAALSSTSAFDAAGTATTLVAAEAVLARNASNLNSGTIALARLPALTLTNIAAGIAGTGTFDFRGSSHLLFPSAADYTAATSGEIGYDTTNLNFHFNVASTDLILLGLPSASPPTTGHCAQFTKIGGWWELTDAGAACGSGGGSLPDPGANGIIYRESLNTYGLASPSQITTAMTDPTVNSAWGFEAGSGAGDSTCPTPISGADYFCYRTGMVQKSHNGGVYAPFMVLSCQPGIGDGLNIIPTGTYPQTNCMNETGTTWTITSIKCYADSGTSTCNVTNGSGTSLLASAITGTSSYASGTQSSTITIASGDVLHITFVPDGSLTKQMNIDISGVY